MISHYSIFVAAYNSHVVLFDIYSMSISRSPSPKQLMQTQASTSGVNVQSNMMMVQHIHNSGELLGTGSISPAELEAINALMLLGLNAQVAPTFESASVCNDPKLMEEQSDKIEQTKELEQAQKEILILENKEKNAEQASDTGLQFQISATTGESPILSSGREIRRHVGISNIKDIKNFVFAQTRENVSHKNIKAMVQEKFNEKISSRSISRWSEGTRVKKLTLAKQRALEFKDVKSVGFIARQCHVAPASVKKWIAEQSDSQSFKPSPQAATKKKPRPLPKLEKSSLPEITEEELSTYEIIEEISKPRLENIKKSVCDYVEKGMTQLDARIQTMRDFKVQIKSCRSVNRWLAERDLLGLRKEKIDEIKKYVLTQIQENVSHKNIKAMVQEKFQEKISSRSISRWSGGIRVKKLALARQQALEFKNVKSVGFIAKQFHVTPTSVKRWLAGRSDDPPFEPSVQASTKEQAVSSVPRVERSTLPEITEEELSTYETLDEISKLRLENIKKRVCDYVEGGMTQSDAKIQTMRDFKVQIKSSRSINRWLAERDLLGLRKEKIDEIKKYVLSMKDSMTIQELSAKVGITENRIGVWIRLDALEKSTI